MRAYYVLSLAFGHHALKHPFNTYTANWGIMTHPIKPLCCSFHIMRRCCCTIDKTFFTFVLVVKWYGATPSENKHFPGPWHVSNCVPQNLRITSLPDHQHASPGMPLAFVSSWFASDLTVWVIMEMATPSTGPTSTVQWKTVVWYVSYQAPVNMSARWH